MTDIDMSVFNNDNLGASNHLPYLDEVVAQADENKHAALEGRVPQKVLSRERFGAYAGLPYNGPLEIAEGTPGFMEKNLDDYFSDREIEKVAEDMDRPIAPIEQDLIEEHTD